MSQILNSIDDASLSHAWLTIGSFDGVHVGHQALIKQLVNGAHEAGAAAVVLTFHPHPVVVLRGNHGNIYLTLPEERAEIFISMGVDTVIVEPFTLGLSQTTAEDFIVRLRKQLGLDHLLVGHDFALGRGREGNFDFLSRIGPKFGFTVQMFEPVYLEGEVVSSSRIRMMVEAGEVKKAAQYLGRPYQMSGTVIPGDHRGRTIGFPTANLSIPSGKICPSQGVYACRALIGDLRWAAATNIGFRPTFDEQGSALHIETHLLDFSEDLYGKTVTLEFIEQLRDEKRFNNVQALIDQIHLDVQQTRKIIFG